VRKVGKGDEKRGERKDGKQRKGWCVKVLKIESRRNASEKSRKNHI
jgi:hypothetical protein